MRAVHEGCEVDEELVVMYEVRVWAMTSGAIERYDITRGLPRRSNEPSFSVSARQILNWNEKNDTH